MCCWRHFSWSRGLLVGKFGAIHTVHCLFEVKLTRSSVDCWFPLLRVQGCSLELRGDCLLQVCWVPEPGSFGLCLSKALSASRAPFTGKTRILRRARLWVSNARVSWETRFLPMDGGVQGLFHGEKKRDQTNANLQQS